MRNSRTRRIRLLSITVACLLANFCRCAQAEGLLKPGWTQSNSDSIQSLLVISGTNGRNNPLRQQLQKPFRGKEIYVIFSLRYEAESLDTSAEDEGEFFVLWSDQEEGGDYSTHIGVPTFGIHVERSTGQNRFMARFVSNKEAYSAKQVQGDQTYFVVGKISRTRDQEGSPFDQIDLWIDPKPTAAATPDVSLRSKDSKVAELNWIGFSTGQKTEPTDRIQVFGLSSVASWEEVFGITPIPELESAIPTKTPKAAATSTVNFRKDVFPILKSKCFECHSGPDSESGVRLDDYDEVLNHVTPRSSESSHLIDLITTDEDEIRMPPVDSGLELTESEINTLKNWIDEGPGWDSSVLPTLALETDHWAFQKIQRPKIPSVQAKHLVRTPVDAFLRSHQERLGLSPAPQAENETFIRRLSLDLLGLPPNENVVPGLSALRDQLENADDLKRNELFDNWINTLLSSPHYGERWGRHWLDVARWAESNGHQHNRMRPHAWRYRDYVVESFRSNKPFDKFLREQIAGDQLEYSDERTIATGFLAAARYSGNELDKEIQRNDILVDITNTTASAFLGLTLECAQCHTHKFDPLTIRDYYQFQDFFTAGQPGNVILETKNSTLKSALDFRWKIFDSVHHRLVESRRARNFPEPILVIPKSVVGGMRKREKQLFDELDFEIARSPQAWGWYSNPEKKHQPMLAPHEMRWPLQRGRKHLNNLKTHLLIRGDVKTKGPVVQASWPAVFGSQPITERPSRVELANWMTSKNNPLTARVWVNRIWQWHFGTGLVETSSDFGTQGTPPSHPELLDWLASELIDTHWNTNHIHKLILNSRTYRQSSAFSSSNQTIDPDNQFLWRWNVHRLDAEAIRDSILAVTGQLQLDIGGPSVPASESETSSRRSLYLAQRRDNLPEQQMLFDSPDFVRSCSRRSVSTAPLQSLYLLNSQFMQKSAAKLASTIQRNGLSTAGEVKFCIKAVYGRSATEEETQQGLQFLEQGTFEDFCLVLLNTNEFVYHP